MNERARIMMVEDSESLSAVYSAYLADRPYSVVTAADLEAARRELGRQQPDIVLERDDCSRGGFVRFADRFHGFRMTDGKTQFNSDVWRSGRRAASLSAGSRRVPARWSNRSKPGSARSLS